MHSGCMAYSTISRDADNNMASPLSARSLRSRRSVHAILSKYSLTEPGGMAKMEDTRDRPAGQAVLSIC